jgi:hypothetical protein
MREGRLLENQRGEKRRGLGLRRPEERAADEEALRDQSEWILQFLPERLHDRFPLSSFSAVGHCPIRKRRSLQGRKQFCTPYFGTMTEGI